MNPLKKLSELGQSVWYDYIRRDLYQGPELQRMIAEDGLKGMTSNPTIFEKAIADSDLYDGDIRAAGQGKPAAAVFEALEVADVRGAADAFRGVYDATGGNDGFVSIEVQPHLAMDTAGTVEEARRLWASCNRPNVMVKIPGTAPGLPAIRRCLAEGININVTLLFSVARHREVMEAYLAGLEERLARGLPVEGIRSVASFFVSRVDTNVDQKLDAILKDAGRAADHARARDLRGKFAVANARVAYEAFEETFDGERAQRLKAQGVHVQRPLWASTSTKDPAYPDLLYVEALVAPQSVNTVPPETFVAYRDHGHPAVRIHDDLPGAHATFQALRDVGIDLEQVYRELEEEGVRKFSDSYDKLLHAVAAKESAVRA